MKTMLKIILPVCLLFSASFVMTANTYGGGDDAKSGISQQVEHTMIVPQLNSSITRNKQAERMKLGGIRNLLIPNNHALTSFRDGDDDKLIAIILCIVFPPLGVAVWENDITKHFWISLLLTFLFWIPGFIYSLLIILK